MSSSSHIEADAVQGKLGLLDGAGDHSDGAPLFQTDAEARECTGAVLFARNPELYSRIIHDLAEGVGFLRISRRLHVGVHTVMAVRDRERVAIDKERVRLSDLARTAARLSIEGIVDDLADPRRREQISTRDKAIVAGVMVEKSELLSGGVTQRIAVVVQPADADFNRILDAEVLEATTIHSGPETPEQKERLELGAGSGLELAPGAAAAGEIAQKPDEMSGATSEAHDASCPGSDRADAPPSEGNR